MIDSRRQIKFQYKSNNKKGLDINYTAFRHFMRFVDLKYCTCFSDTVTYDLILR